MIYRGNRIEFAEYFFCISCALLNHLLVSVLSCHQFSPLDSLPPEHCICYDSVQSTIFIDSIVIIMQYHNKVKYQIL